VRNGRKLNQRANGRITNKLIIIKRDREGFASMGRSRVRTSRQNAMKEEKVGGKLEKNFRLSNWARTGGKKFVRRREGTLKYKHLRDSSIQGPANDKEGCIQRGKRGVIGKRDPVFYTRKSILSQALRFMRGNI